MIFLEQSRDQDDLRAKGDFVGQIEARTRAE